MEDYSEQSEEALLIDIPVQISSSQQAQRLFHGRGYAYHGYEHLSIDWFAPIIILITLLTEQSLIILPIIYEWKI